MTTLVSHLASGVGLDLPAARTLAFPFNRRALALAVLSLAALVAPGGVGLLLASLAEAYLSVAVFVAGTLAIVHLGERRLGIDLGAWLDRHRRWQVPAAALLGAFPGCGGAIVAVTQYAKGHLGFGGLLAALSATMGDAMFLLLAREPGTGAAMFGIGLVAGIVTGYAVDALHGPDFMRASRTPTAETRSCRRESRRRDIVAETAWLWLAVPGVAVGVAGAFRVDVDAWLATVGVNASITWLGIAGSLLSLAMWVRDGSDAGAPGDEGRDDAPGIDGISPVITTTNFVTAWVVFAFAGFELLVALAGIDLSALAHAWAPLVPVLAVLVGFIPGCGPQIMVTTLYLAGAAPLSAQIGNAIANDGDALFPAIATSPRAALVATFYSAVPALVAAYGWYFLVEA